jgi:hypothetical protein
MVGIGATMQTGTPLSIETPPKSSGNTDQGLMKKLKGFDGLAMSIGNGHAESAEPGAESKLSQRFVDLFSLYMKFDKNIHTFYLSFLHSLGGRNPILFMQLLSNFLSVYKIGPSVGYCNRFVVANEVIW